MNVFDASALLCFLKAEVGADTVEREMLIGGACSAANWSEIAQKLIFHGQDWGLCRGLLLAYPITIEPVTMADAERAATIWRSGSGLSLSDRLCLATGERLDAIIWTADTAWGTSKRIRQIR